MRHYRGISSMKLLEHVGCSDSQDHGYVVGNIDATVIAQQPKLRPYIRNRMEEECSKRARDFCGSGQYQSND